MADGRPPTGVEGVGTAFDALVDRVERAVG
jgi:hypothetical protein